MSYSPYWKAYSGADKLSISMANDGLVIVHVPKYIHEISLRYEDAWYRYILLCFGITLLAVLFVLKQ
jgi:uncharacterized membrane protein YfhO